MERTNAIDSINSRTMRAAVRDYARNEALHAAEEAVIKDIAAEIRGKRILDIGVGAGRTTKALRELSEDYVGIDYVREMVEHCREIHPGVRFEWADARAMPHLADDSFDLVVFSCNGISMVDHDGRIAILKEVHRILAPGGKFVFSTYNRDSENHANAFERPWFQWTRHPIRLALRTGRFVAQSLLRRFNRFRYKRHQIFHADYSIINDRCHDYATMLYYITVEGQLRQLASIGFKPHPAIYDARGHRVTDSVLDDSMTFLVST